MTVPARGGRSARLCGVASVAVAAVATIPAALASDAELQRALLDSGCLEPRIETLLQRRDLVAYRANCLGSSDKTVVIVCSKGRCSPERPGKPFER